MVAAVIEMNSWIGQQQYFFEGEKASDILFAFESVQDLSCLVRMGRMEEGTAEGQKALDTLEVILEKYYDGELTMHDLKEMDIKISIGAIKCLAIAEDEKTITELKTNYPNARG